MIACSAHVDEIVFLMTQQAGFDTTLACPMTNKDIERAIIPLVENRKEMI